MTSNYNRPLIFSAFKPARITSYDVVRHFKRNLPKGYKKIGHFGTLDPFATGVLMVGINGAQRLNDYVHEFLPKTYLAIGKLGVETPTGDLTVEPTQIDNSEYLNQNIANFDEEFIEDFIKENFLGDYWQAPHKYSAAKYEGKALHKWAREGVEIQKEKKLRHVYNVEVVKYKFPYLSIRFTVSSGTYIRTLFSDSANKLGTIGTLVSLVRESVGICDLGNSTKKSSWPDGNEWDFDSHCFEIDHVLPFSDLFFAEKEAKLYSNGVALRKDRAAKIDEKDFGEKMYWCRDIDGKLLGLAKEENGELKIQFNFASSSS